MRLNVFYSSILVSLGGILGVGAALAQITSVPPATYLPPALSKAAAVQRLLSPDAPRRVVALPAPSAKERELLKSVNAAEASNSKLGPAAAATGKGRPLAVGYGRDVPAQDRSISGTDLDWQPLADGSRAARIDVSSTGAAAIRIALAMDETDPDVTLRFVGSQPGATVFGPYPANRIAEESNQQGVFWSPILEGSTGAIEVYLPAGMPADELRLDLKRISHLMVAGAAVRNVDPKATGIGGAGSCEIDVACVMPQTTELTNAAKSVARIIFTQEDGLSSWCTATMLNDSQTSFTPYVFSASHCLNSQYAATTLNLYWFFDAVACRSLADPPYVLQAGGAKLLARSDDWDWALVRLNSPPPAGVTFSAWNADPLSEIVTTTTVHHPMADLKKWSQGTTNGFHSYDDGSVFIEVLYQQGSTEGGSSGSALMTFNGARGYYEVRGGLFGGSASCRNTSGFDIYSRLDNGLPLLRQYLTPSSPNASGAVPVVEFYNALLDDNFITINPAEINDLDIGVHPGWVRTGLSFLAWPDQKSAPAGASPVCRYYSVPPADSHFYSVIPSTCVETGVKFPNWVLEQSDVFYIYVPDKTTGACPAGYHSVFQFLNNSNGLHHRYTAEVAQRDAMIDIGGWTQEGYGNPARGSIHPEDRGQVAMCSPNE